MDGMYLTLQKELKCKTDDLIIRNCKVLLILASLVENGKVAYVITVKKGSRRDPGN